MSFIGWIGFIGRKALLRQKEAGIKKRLVQFLLKDPEPLLYHNEPIWRDGEIVGHITSGAYGHTLGAAVGLGYVSGADVADTQALLASSYELEVAGERYAATASLKPMYDPDNLKIRC